VAIIRPLKYINLKLQFSTSSKGRQTEIASSWSFQLASI